MPKEVPFSSESRNVLMITPMADALRASGFSASEGTSIFALALHMMLKAAGLTHEQRVEWYAAADAELDAKFDAQYQEAKAQVEQEQADG